MTYKAIVFALSVQHGIILSVRHLIRILHSRNLTRRKNQTDFNIVVDFIMEEQRQSGIMHGYRWMHQKCKERGIRVWKEDVRLLMSLLDPESVALRRRHRLFRRMYHARGPNYLWHLDSYDKLRPYGICINGCIDGFSRKMIWLNAYFTSSDPKIIGGYFLEVVKEFGGAHALSVVTVVRKILMSANFKDFFDEKEMMRFKESAVLCMGEAQVTRGSKAGGASYAKSALSSGWPFLIS